MELDPTAEGRIHFPGALDLFDATAPPWAGGTCLVSTRSNPPLRGLCPWTAPGTEGLFAPCLLSW